MWVRRSKVRDIEQAAFERGYAEAADGYLATIERLNNTCHALRALQLELASSKGETLVVVSRRRYEALKTSGRYTVVTTEDGEHIEKKTASGVLVAVTPAVARALSLSEVVA